MWKKALLVALASAFVAGWWSLLQTPTYEASAVLLVNQKEQSDGKIQPIANAPLGVYAHEMSTMAIETRPVAEGVIRRLGVGGSLSPGELLDNLIVEQVDSSRFIRLNYTDTSPGRAPAVANMVGQVSSERISMGSGTDSVTPTLFAKARISDGAASPKPAKNGLIAFVAGLAISSTALFAVRRGWLRHGGTGYGWRRGC